MNRKTGYQPRHARRRGLSRREHLAAAIGVSAGMFISTAIYIAIEVSTWA